MRERSGRAAWLARVLPVALLVGSCARSASGEPGTSNAAAAAGTAGAAAVLSVVGGCKLQNNCPYGSFCNHDTGFCVTRTCAEGCPGNTVCNEGLNRCQDPPPARPPSDRLPQDDKIQYMPGTH
jgi:hypothetical protein